MTNINFKNSDKYKRIVKAEGDLIATLKKALEDNHHPQDIYISLCYLTAAWQNRIRFELTEDHQEELKEKGFKSVEDFMWGMKHAAYKDFENDLLKIKEDFKGFFNDQAKI